MTSTLDTNSFYPDTKWTNCIGLRASLPGLNKISLINFILTKIEVFPYLDSLGQDNWSRESRSLERVHHTMAEQIDDHHESLIALSYLNNQFYIETNDSQTAEWQQLVWEEILDGPPHSLCVHNDVIYSIINGSVCTIDVQQQTVEKLFSLQFSSWPRDLLVLDGVLYIFILDHSISNIAGSRYCLESKQRSTISPTKVSCKYSQFVVCQGYIYAIEVFEGFEGFRSNNFEGSKVQRYCPQTDEWEIVFERKRQGRGYVGGYKAAVLNGKIYVCGGHKNSSVSNAVGCFDPETKRWKCLGNMNQARSNHSMVAWNGELWSIGGSGERFTGLSSVEVYNPISNSWSMVSSMKNIEGPVWGGVLSNVPSNQ